MDGLLRTFNVRGTLTRCRRHLRFGIWIRRVFTSRRFDGYLCAARLRNQKWKLGTPLNTLNGRLTVSIEPPSEVSILLSVSKILDIKQVTEHMIALRRTVAICSLRTQISECTARPRTTKNSTSLTFVRRQGLKTADYNVHHEIKPNLMQVSSAFIDLLVLKSHSVISITQFTQLSFQAKLLLCQSLPKT